MSCISDSLCLFHTSVLWYGYVTSGMQPSLPTKVREILFFSHSKIKLLMLPLQSGFLLLKSETSLPVHCDKNYINYINRIKQNKTRKSYFNIYYYYFFVVFAVLFNGTTIEH